MTFEKFMGGINYLNSIYTNFKFDVTNKIKCQFWFDKFKFMTDEEFTKTLKAYTNVEEYAPQSTASILKYFKQTLIAADLQPQEAWEKMREICWRNGGITYCYSKVKKAMQTYPLIDKVFNEYLSRIDGMSENDVFLAKEFQARYKELLNQKAEELVKNRVLQIGGGKNNDAKSVGSNRLLSK